MAGQFTRLQKTYKIMDSDGVGLYTGVTYGANENECVKPTVDNAVPLGVVDNDERTLEGSGSPQGKMVAVKLEGIALLRLGESVKVGDRIYLGAGGVGKKVPDTPNDTPINYNVLGFAEKSGVAGDVIPVRMAYHVYPY